jgi:hypothetical protein
MRPDGDLTNELQAIRSAAVTHRQRIEGAGNDVMTETDRTSLLAAWDKIIRDADTAKIGMANMRDSLTSALSTLRLRSHAMSEMILASEYQAVLNVYNAWLADLQKSMVNLHAIIKTPVS